MISEMAAADSHVLCSAFVMCSYTHWTFIIIIIIIIIIFIYSRTIWSSEYQNGKQY